MLPPQSMARDADGRGRSARIISLECARGVASVIVLIHHFTLAFCPSVRVDYGQGGIYLTPLFALINGSGAVVFFFALSGFVLTHRFYSRPSPVPILAAALKRLPRLIVPAGASIILGLLILSYGGGAYRVAASFSHSKWLAAFGNAGIPEGLQPSLMDALKQSLLVFLTWGHYYYNSNLWTMVTEFYGSLVVFAVVLLFTIPFMRRWPVMAAVHGLLIVVLWARGSSFLPFIAGSLLAYVETRPAVGAFLRLPRRTTWLLLAGALIGFSGESLVGNSLASIAALLALLGDQRLSAQLSGPVGRWMGLLSFPLYLVHTLVILSVSSALYVRLALAGATGVTLLLPVFVVTAVTAGALALLFMLLDTAWVGWLNRRVRALLPVS